MKSKTKIEKQLKNKNDKELVETILAAKKNPNWYKVAEVLASPRKNHVEINLEEINKIAEDKKIIVVPGKILSQGDISKKYKIAALKFSEKAKEKLIKAGCEVLSILDEINKNKYAKDVEVILK